MNWSLWLKNFNRAANSARRTRPQTRLNLISFEERINPSSPVAPNGFTATTTTFTNDTDVTIPTTITSVTQTIVVSGVGTYLHDVDLTTFIQHTFNADLDITLTSPAGTVVTITSDNAGGNDNVYNGTLFDDSADPGGVLPFPTTNTANSVTDTTYVNLVVKPTLTPEEALAAFIGENPNGTWTLTVSDDASGDGGLLDRVTLAITTLNAPITPPAATTATNSTGGAIPDDGAGLTVLSSTITVSGAQTYLLDLNLQTFIVHANAAHLDFTITSPQGTVVTISTDNGGATANVYNGTIWDDSADPGNPAPFSANTFAASNLVGDTTYTTNVVKTTLVPEEPLAAFRGENPNGVWTLTIDDDTTGTAGTLTSWSLIFSAIAASPNPTISGVTVPDQNTSDEATVNPFSGVSIGDPNGDNVVVVVTLSAANGTLAGGGFTGSGLTYTLASGTTAAATTAIRALVFTPNSTADGVVLTTDFTISVTDPANNNATDNQTTVVATGVTPPVNDLAAGAIALTLNVPFAGTTINATNNYTLPASSPSFNGVGQAAASASTSPDRDVVYTFTATTAGQYDFRVYTEAGNNADSVLYVMSVAPTSGVQTEANLLSSANRRSTLATDTEEVSGVTLTAGQKVWIVVDGNVFATGGAHTVLVSQSPVETTGDNNTPTGAGVTAYTAASFGTRGSISPVADFDYYSLGTVAANARIFAFVDAGGSASGDLDMRITTATATLEYDDLDGDTRYGSSGFSPLVAGTLGTGVATYIQLSGFSATTVYSPYRLYAVVQGADTTATAETEGNDTVATANIGVNNYFSGALSAATDVDVFKFRATAGETVFVGLDLAPARGTTSFDGIIDLLDASGAVIFSVNGSTTSATTTPGTTLTSTTPTWAGEGLVFNAAASGFYYARVRAASTTFGAYLLSISRNGALGGGVAPNTPPTLVAANVANFGSIAEDVPAASNTGTLVSTLLPASAFTDPDDTTRGIAISAADTANGSWQFSLDGGANWAALGTVTATSSRLIAADADNRVRFLPNANFNGTVSPGITYSAWDLSVGTDGGLADASVTGGTSAFSTATASSNIVVTDTPDTPSVTPATTDEDTQSASGLVVSRNAGDTTAVTHFKITNIVNGTLFLNDGMTAVTAGSFITFAQANAGLKFTPTLNFNGTGTFDIQGSTSAADAGLGGGIATASVTVNPINDAPTLNALSDATIAANAGLQTVNLSGISAGPANESTQTVTIAATSGNQTLIPNGSIAVNYTTGTTGTLTYTSATGQSGTAVITVTVTDNGPTGGTNVNSFVRTFTVVVNPQPTVSLGVAPSNFSETGGSAVVTATLSGVSPQAVVVTLGYAGTATGSGTDYTAPTTITIAAGQLTGTANIAAVGDGLVEGSETVLVSIASATFATPSGSAVTATIVDDDVSPAVTNVTSTTADAAYGVGKVIAITVTFSTSVTVTGTPQLALATGGVASYVSGTGTSTLTFNYTVAAAQTSADLDYTGTGSLTLNGGTIRDSFTNPAVLTLPAPGAAGSLGANKAIVIETVAPVVLSSNRVTAANTSLATVDFTVTFSEPVANVDTADFTATQTGLTFANVTNVAMVSSSVYTVTVSLGTGTGTVRLDVPSTATILDVPGNAFATAFTTGQVYNVSRNFPSVVSILATPSATPTNAATLAYTVTFTEAVAGVDATDFTLTATGLTGASIGTVTGSGTVWTVNVNTGTGDGTIRLNLVDNDSVVSTPGGVFLAGPGANNGNFSSAVTTIDKTVPTVTSIVRTTPTAATTNAASVTFTATFSEAVATVTSANFALATAGLTGASITSVAGSGTTYTVVVNTGSGSGSVGLNFASSTGVSDPAGNAATAPVVGAVYTIDKTAPVVSSIARTTPPTASTNAASVTFTVTFSEAVTGVSAGNFSLASTGVTGASITSVTGSGATYTVVVNTGSGDGSVGLNLSRVTPIVDAVGNALTATFTGPVYTVVKSAPTVVSIVPTSTTLTGITYTVTFSKAVTGLDASDFQLVTTGVTGASLGTVTGSGATYTVTVNSGTGDGTVRLNLIDDDSIADPTGNKLGGTGIGNGNAASAITTYDRTAPAVTVSPASTPGARTVTYIVTFSEPVVGLTADDFVLGGTANPKTVTIAGTGPSYTITVSGMTDSGTVSLALVAAAATDPTGNPSPAVAPVVVSFAKPAEPKDGVPTIAVGSDAGQPGVARLINATTGATLIEVKPFGFSGGFSGGVRVAAGDVDGDGVDDLIVGAGFNGGPHIKVYDGVTGNVVRSFYAFDPLFNGGVSLAAGDFNGDGRADVVVAAGAGGGPQVTVFDALTGAVIHNFFAFETTFTGGLSVAVGDIDGDGLSDIVVAAGAGGGPRVKSFSGKDLSVLSDGYVYDRNYTGGVTVALGDFNRDGKMDIVTAPGVGGGGHIQVFYNGDLTGSDKSLFAFPEFAGTRQSVAPAIRIGVTDVNLDGIADLVVGTGPGTASRVRVINGFDDSDISTMGESNSFLGGIFVGGTTK